MNPDKQRTLMSAIVYQHRQSSRFELNRTGRTRSPSLCSGTGEIPLMWIRRASDQTAGSIADPDGRSI